MKRSPLLFEKLARLISIGELISELEAGPHVEFVNGADSTHVAQTGWCYSPVPHTVCFAANAKWLTIAHAEPNVSVILTTAKAFADFPLELQKPIVVSDRAGEVFHRLHRSSFHARCYTVSCEETPDPIHPTAQVDATAILRGTVVIEEGVRVGPLTVIHGPIRIGAGTKIDEYCTVGSSGLFAKRIGGRLAEYPFFGGTIIGQSCHIHARSNIARSPHYGSVTELGDEVSLGIGSNVGHDCIIGSGTTLASTSCVCGHSIVSQDCWVGAGAIVSDSVTIGESSRVRVGAVVINDQPSGADVSGNFARSHRLNLSELAKSRR